MKKILLVFLASSSVFAMDALAQHLDSTFNTNGYLPYLGPNSNNEGNLKVLFRKGVSPVSIDSDYQGIAILKLQTADGKAGTRKMLFE